MAERFMAAVLKTVGQQCPGGSNPSPSAGPGSMEESHSGLVRPPAKRLPGETWIQGSNPCSSASLKVAPVHRWRGPFVSGTPLHFCYRLARP